MDSLNGIATDAGIQILHKFIDDFYDYAKDKIKLAVDKRVIEAKIPSLLNKVRNVRMVKTLWQIDRAVDVESFYCDSHVLIPDKQGREQIRIKVDKVSDFGTKRNIVIKGIAGQGKSIFLRHLFIKEFELGNRLPIFIELRRIQSNETLLTHIERFLDILDVKIAEELFKSLLNSGKFIFFLDGYDEINENQVQPIINELEYLASMSDKSQFIVTSRPHSSIEMSSLFDVMILDDLRDEEYITVIRNLAESKEYAEALISKIKGDKENVSQLLCTPLLVTLLLISYKTSQTLPERLSDFYESIFSVLLRRHDGSKPGFARQRRCSINDNQYRDIFDVFCFESMKHEESIFDYRTSCDLIQKAMSILHIKEDSTDYLNDIINVTCLFLYESGQYRFIHKSVQEYYAASFIKHRAEQNAINFYQSALKLKSSIRWHQVLSFLSEIDSYRFNKYYLIPRCNNYLGLVNIASPITTCPTVTTEQAKILLKDYSIGISVERHTIYSVSYPVHDSFTELIERDSVTHLFRLDYSFLAKKIEDGTLESASIEESDSDVGQMIIIPLSQVIEKGGLIVKKLIWISHLIWLLSVYNDAIFSIHYGCSTIS